MSNKEYVTIVLDSSEYMNLKSTQNQTKTDFELGLQFTFNFFNQQLLKNRKSDRYAFVVYTPGEIQSVYYNEPLSLRVVKEYYKLAVDAHEKGDSHSHGYGKNDIIDAFGEALNKQIANKFVRSVFVITNGRGKITDPTAKVDNFKQICLKYSVSCTFLLVGKKDNNLTRDYLSQMCSELGDYCKVFDYADYVENWRALRLINPRSLCDTHMSFASIGGKEQDTQGINLRVQVYPAIRVQSHIHGHDYIVEDKSSSPTKVKRDTRYYMLNDPNIANEVFDYIKDQTESKQESTKLYLKRADVKYGFKYTQRDIYALGPEIEEAATLSTSCGINILGFIKTDRLSIPFFSEESSYVIPSTKFYSDNKIAFNSLVQALLESKSAAIVRYVQKDSDEVQICAALPQKIVIEGDRHGRVLLMIRLAMKEDEMVGHFPRLEEKDETLDMEMEKLISIKTLANDNTKPDELDNPKCGLTQSKASVERVTKDTPLERILLSTCPATKRFNYYVEKILYQALSKSSLTDFLGEENFVEKYLTKDEAHTLFNMDNILDAKQAHLYSHRELKEADVISKTLRKRLETKYKLKEAQPKKKRKFMPVFGVENNDGNFDEYFDVDDMLA
ncbi:YKU80 [Candida oxycetoniae]|uniref:DNA helicase n=1 Tax=Candida oxycetoniae TaxID=497107 RepID=A0AAI9WX01_9ASCO|nr:YKU80 [Candida oxycetoniae]KAI3403791.2 YKU80 [Candida oxycetoniae]